MRLDGTWDVNGLAITLGEFGLSRSSAGHTVVSRTKVGALHLTSAIYAILRNGAWLTAPSSGGLSVEVPKAHAEVAIRHWQ